MIRWEKNYMTGNYDVFLKNRKVGEIRLVFGGWEYYHNGNESGGGVYKTLTQCEWSIV